MENFLKDNIFFISKRKGTSENAVFISNPINNPSITKIANSKDLLKNLIPFFYYVSEEFVKRGKSHVDFTKDVYSCIKFNFCIDPVNIGVLTIRKLIDDNDAEARYNSYERGEDDESNYDMYDFYKHKKLLTKIEKTVERNPEDTNYFKVFNDNPFRIVINVSKWYSDEEEEEEKEIKEISEYKIKKVDKEMSKKLINYNYFFSM